MTVTECLNKGEFDAVVAAAGDKIVIVDFYATWCGPCKIMGPKFHKFAEEFPNAVYIKVDVDEADSIMASFEVRVMPTFIFMRGGEIVHTMEGNKPDDLKAAIAKYTSE